MRGMYLSMGDRASDSPIIGYRGDANANQSGDLAPEGEYRVKVYFQHRKWVKSAGIAA